MSRVHADPTPEAGPPSTTLSTFLAEVTPGVVAVYGEQPSDLELESLDLGLVPATDRTTVNNALATLGAGATTVGHLGHAAAASFQGLYRLSDSSQALLNAGGTLAVKDGANLGAILVDGKIVGQARLVPIDPVSLTQLAVAIGPALSMIALQAQLNQVTGLVKQNIALTSQVLSMLRNEQWATLTGLVDTIGHALEEAHGVGSVPTSLWGTVASKRADLRTQRELYRRHVTNHIESLQGLDTRSRREYLQTNAQAIFFDANALLSTLKAWTGFQMLYATHTRDSGNDPDAAEQLTDTITQRTRTELETALPEVGNLIDDLTRELRIFAELPGTSRRGLSARRKDARAMREMSAQLVEALEPLADSLRAPSPRLHEPEILAAPDSLDREPYLRILRWFLDSGETLRAMAFPQQIDASGAFATLLSGAKDKLPSVLARDPERTLVAVTDRRVITADCDELLEQGELGRDLSLDDVRYLRVTHSGDHEITALDLITRDENIRWRFDPSIDRDHVNALASVLAESVSIPQSEVDQLRRVQPPAINTATDPSGVDEPEPAGAERGV